MILFAITVFFLVITPGPGVLSAAGVSAAFGRKPGAYYVFGLFLGHNIVAIATVSGLAALLLADPRIRTVLFILSTAYMLYLALKIATAGTRVAFIETKQPPGVIGGLMLQVINPKAYAVNTAIFSGFSFFPGNLATEVATKFLIFNAIWIPIHLLWLWFGITLRRLDLSETTHHAIYVGMSFSMLFVVGLAVYAFAFRPN